MLATRLSKSSLLVRKRADGEVDPSLWVLLNPRNAADGALQPEEAKLGHTKGLPTLLYAHCLSVTRRRVERKLCVFVCVECDFLGNVHGGRRKKGTRVPEMGSVWKALVALFAGATAGRQL